MRNLTFSFITNAGKIADSNNEEKLGETSLHPCFQMKMMVNILTRKSKTRISKILNY